MTVRQKLAIKRLELNKNTEIYVDYKTKEKTDDIEVVLDLLKEDKNVKEKMTIEQAQEILDELQRTEPDKLKGEAKKLFEAIMKIADERDELKKQVRQKDKIIHSMTEYISEHTDCPCENEGKDLDCEKMCDVRIDRDCWKIYFENKVKEKNND